MEELTMKETKDLVKAVLNKKNVSVTYSYKGKAKDYSIDKVQTIIKEK